MDLTQYFISFAALVPLVVLISDFIIRTLSINKSWLRQLTGWGISLVLTMFGFWQNIGFLADMTWWQAIISGLAMGLSANGLFDITGVQWILDLLLKFLPKKE